MTTTIMFSGKEGKNSSKVLAPPGGKSNNIFGFAEETPAPAPMQRKAPSQSPFAQDTPPKSQDCGPAKPFKPVSSFNPVTGEPHSYAKHNQPPQQQQQQASPAPQQQKTQSASPPQQQQQQTSPQQQQQASALPQQPSAGNTETKTSVKIYNPPGGRSSIQF